MGRKENSKVFALMFVLALAFFFSLIQYAEATTQCSDSVDNDKDGNIDFPNDSGCISPSDTDENLLLYYAHGCLSKGNRLKNVFGQTTYECQSDICQLCVGVYEAGNYSAGSHCNSLPRCTFGSGNSSSGIDIQAQNITVLNPILNGIYNSKSILLEVDLDELVELFISNQHDQRFSRLCGDCSSYSKKRTFFEGQNDFLLKAIDLKDNFALRNLSFFVDSKKPRITKVEPRSGFISNNFNIFFQELNPLSLSLLISSDYANLSIPVDINSSCLKTDSANDKFNCTFIHDMSEFNNQTIYYKYNLTDIAGNSILIRPIKIKVDTEFPIIDFFSFDQIEDNRFVLNMSVIDENFNKVEYYDSLSSRPRWTTICSSLRSGFCSRTLSLQGDLHNISIRADDKAGNSDFEYQII